MEAVLDFQATMMRKEEQENEVENTLISAKKALEKNNYSKYKAIISKHFVILEDNKPGDNVFSIFADTVTRRGFKDEFNSLLKGCKPLAGMCDICQKKGKGYFLEYFHWFPQSYCHFCEQSKYKDELKNKMNEILSKRVGIRKRYMMAKIEDFPEKYKGLSDYEEKEGLFLYGPRGTGKTHLMAAIARKEIENMSPAINMRRYYSFRYDDAPLFIPVPSLLAKIRGAFRKDSKTTEIELIEYFSEKDVLLLDDLGAEKPTEWALQTLYMIIDRRYSEMKRTIISSNYNLDEIADRLDDRISSRIAGMCKVVNLKGKDKRI